MTAEPTMRATTVRPGVNVTAADLASMAIVIFLLLLLARHSLWWDEATTARLMQFSFPELLGYLFATQGSETSQPLYYMLLWPVTAVFGTSDAVLRLPSVLFVALGAFALRASVSVAGVDSKRAAWSTPLFLLLPVIMWYALEARPYALIILLVSAHLWYAMRYEDGQVHVAGHLGLLTLLVALSYAVAGLAALVIALYAFLSSPDRYRRFVAVAPGQRAFALGGAGFAAVFVIVTVFKSGSPGVPEARQPLLTLAYTGYELLLGRTVAWSTGELRTASPSSLLSPSFDLALVLLLATLVVACLAKLSPLALKTTAARELAPIGAMWIATALAFMAYSILAGFPLLGRHLVYAMPPAFALLFVAALSAPARVRRASAAIVIVIGLFGAFGLAIGERHLKSDFRGASALIEACATDAQGIVIAAPRAGFEHYLAPATFATVDFLGLGSGPDDMAAVTTAGAQIVVLEQAYWDPDGVLAAAHLSEVNALTERIPGFTVLIDRSLADCVPAD